MNSLAEIAEVIHRTRRFFLCGHVNPDGDSIGSVLALGLGLQRLGKDVIMASPNPVPENLFFLPAADRIITVGSSMPETEIFIMLDCSEQERLGPAMGELSKTADQIIVLDHHPFVRCAADYYYIDPAAAATGEIVYDLLELMEIYFDPEIAVCLYTAIITDTGSFQYSNTTADTHLRAARLLASGVDVPAVGISLYGERSLTHLKTLGAALNNLRMDAGGRLAWIILTREMLDEISAADEDCENLINYPRMIKGVEVALFFQEIDEELFKISFRSKGSIDVNKIAGAFGGGGHVLASGCRLSGKLSEVEETVIFMVKQALLRNVVE
ncbi:phosphoesterase RecJ domain protein [Desulfofarcimen acetoxidans DSM 771]|uniref:Phosphoesterase RecJ domain protein n=1 Tax=Desulfofarcimen acetoxidans (strain ATCC 49208 / DSM 771 / KCTC 5769 / VKM B-1644 / 5575) TaxID=485916 RepID=C8W4P2_DESAS|nr:bifunctional oligoribonuclease/PAP phosphatase NrnA [Desulfofarcimen acetoxidans]ACV63928.1 phosphoesterase RecJ domain protein [Desulfofarcimen acetoxidans DSM 771]